MARPEIKHPSRIWLVEDNERFRRTLAAAINQIDGLSCPKHFSTCEDALADLSSGDAPEVILLDVALPGMSGLEGLAMFKRLFPAMCVIILTVFEEDEKIFRAICAGASGYLLKTSSVEEIGNAIRESMSGGAHLSAQVGRRVLDMLAEFAPQKTNYGLNRRENEVLQLMIAGCINKEIAERLSISFHTVDTHVRHIYGKLKVNTRGGAVAKALKERLV